MHAAQTAPRAGWCACEHPFNHSVRSPPNPIADFGIEERSCEQGGYPIPFQQIVSAELPEGSHEGDHSDTGGVRRSGNIGRTAGRGPSTVERATRPERRGVSAKERRGGRALPPVLGIPRRRGIRACRADRGSQRCSIGRASIGFGTWLDLQATHEPSLSSRPGRRAIHSYRSWSWARFHVGDARRRVENRRAGCRSARVLRSPGHRLDSHAMPGSRNRSRPEPPERRA